MSTTPRRPLALLPWLLLTFAVAAIGVFTLPGAWYAALRKPWFTPPSWLFGPVWTLLYALMAVAAWRIYERERRWSLPLRLWLLQLVLNALWSPLFFGLHRPGWALLDIGLLGLAVSATILRFWRRDHISAALLLPYVAWTGYATLLNAGLWWLNR